MVDFPYYQEDEYPIAREELAKRRRALLVQAKLDKEAGSQIRKYKSALASGRFDRAGRLAREAPTLRFSDKQANATFIRPLDIAEKAISETGQFGLAPTTSGANAGIAAMFGKAKARSIRYLRKSINFIKFLNELSSIESVNSPLLDLFGPVQMDKAMRKASPRRKYLMRDGEDGGA